MRFRISREEPLSDPVQTIPTAVAYGRVSRRLRAYLIDWIIFVLLLVAVLFIAVWTESNQMGRILGFALIGIWLLYEPVLVSLTGSSVGHYLSNLRVVDDKTGGNVGFLKASARLFIKTALGLYSFITMAATSRHQAVHDLVTRSTVQIRDLSKATPHQYVGERTELLAPTMPPRWRRLIVTVAYIVCAFAVAMLVAFGTARLGIVSRACIVADRCSSTENLIMGSVGVLWLAASVIFIIQGWRARLFGCRRRVDAN
jgi:uncharacterized RDD family membrane protein YckC